MNTQKSIQQYPLRKSFDKIDANTANYNKGQSSVFHTSKDIKNNQTRSTSTKRLSTPSIQSNNNIGDEFSTPIKFNGYSQTQKINKHKKNNSHNFNNQQNCEQTSSQKRNQTVQDMKLLKVDLLIHDIKNLCNQNYMKSYQWNSKNSLSQARLTLSGKKNRSSLNNISNAVQIDNIFDMNPFSRGIQQTTQSVLFHTNISGANVKYNENVIDKRQISKLGLKLQPICSKEGHERSKISYVCSDLLCTNKLKFGCAHCFLDNHAEHAIRKLKIDEFVDSIESKHQQYIESVCNLINLTKVMENPIFLKSILVQMDKIKEEFILQFDMIKQKFESQIRDEISSDNSIIQGEIDKQNIYLKSLKRTMQKNVFEMSDEEFGYALNIHHDTFTSDLMKRTKVIQDRYQELENQYYSQFQQIKFSLNEQLNGMHSLYNDFDTLFKQNQQNSSNIPYEKYSSFSIKPICVDQNHQNQYSQNDSSIKLKDQEEQHFKQQYQKDCKEDIQLSNDKQTEQIHTTKDNEQYNNFPYNIYKECCDHTIKCNTIPIFECCKQAYQCTLCHDTQTNHKHMSTCPSKRYCFKCFKVINVKYFTNIAINCKDCLGVKTIN